MFSDLEGGCGPKEKNLLVMQKKFEYSFIDTSIKSMLSFGERAGMELDERQAT